MSVRGLINIVISFVFFMPFLFLRHLIDRRRCGNRKSAISNDKHMTETHQEHPRAITLEKLPVEILQYIATVLGPESVACLTVCSKALQWSIGNQSWFALQNEDQKIARISFLNSLQRDLHDWLLCYHCEKLHPFAWKLETHRQWNYRHEHPCSQADGVVYLTYTFEFRF